MMKNIILSISIFASLVSCTDTKKADGYGNFEATEVTVSSEANGKINFLQLEEGDVLAQDKLVGLVDTIQLYLSKQQLLASRNTIHSKSGNVMSQINVLKEQLKIAQTEKVRIENMFSENAATQRQVDDVKGRVSVLAEQIKSVRTQNAPIVNEVRTLDVQIEKINDQINKSKIINPIKGTVLSKYAEPLEVTAFGKPIYKIADMTEMILRVYVSGTQLSEIAIGQTVDVKIDVKEGMETYGGTISWISAAAEFTPKIIQTKEERVTLVYAVKILVDNDGSLKIGMPAEMWVKQ